MVIALRRFGFYLLFILWWFFIFKFEVFSSGTAEGIRQRYQVGGTKYTATDAKTVVGGQWFSLVSDWTVLGNCDLTLYDATNTQIAATGQIYGGLFPTPLMKSGPSLA